MRLRWVKWLVVVRRVACRWDAPHYKYDVQPLPVRACLDMAKDTTSQGTQTGHVEPAIDSLLLLFELTSLFISTSCLVIV